MPELPCPLGKAHHNFHKVASAHQPVTEPKGAQAPRACQMATVQRGDVAGKYSALSTWHGEASSLLSSLMLTDFLCRVGVSGVLFSVLWMGDAGFLSAWWEDPE